MAASPIMPETLFKALGDSTRQRALVVLSKQELSVGELVEVLSQPQSTVSRHLRILREAGLIRDRREGNIVHYVSSRVSSDDNQFPLKQQLLTWVAEQPIPRAMESRLDSVLKSRRDLSDRFFTQMGDKWDQLRQDSFGDRFHLEALLSLLARKWTVADIGTGTGYLLPILANQFERVIAVDPVEEMLVAARGRLDRAGNTNVDLRRGDLSALPIEDESVDLAIAMLVLHHVPVPGEALAEMNRILKPGGTLLLVEQVNHNSDSFRERMQDRWWGFEPAALADQLAGAGFCNLTWNVLNCVDLSADAPELFVVKGNRGTAESSS